MEIEEEETGIVIEVRYDRDGNLGKGCREALAQTEQQRYEQQQSDDGMRTVLKYGVACYKKQCQTALADTKKE